MWINGLDNTFLLYFFLGDMSFGGRTADADVVGQRTKSRNKFETAVRNLLFLTQWRASTRELSRYLDWSNRMLSSPNEEGHNLNRKMFFPF